MAKAWLDERLAVLIPQLAALTAEQEEEIARLCAEEIAAWRARPQIKKATALRPVMTAARKALKEGLKVTQENRYKHPRTGQYEHLALKYLNFSTEEWDELNAISDARLETRLQSQQLIENYQEVIARAEKLLQSERWDELVTGLALVTGRRLTELLKTGRFFPKTAYTLVFDGQLKRRDLDLRPYEIPVIVQAEMVLVAWRRLRALEDTSKLDNEQVAQKYSRVASETANRHFSGLIPLRSEKEDLYTHSFRAVYARLAVLFYCPTTTSELVYVNGILGHYNATDERKQRDLAATAHYFDYRIGDGAGQIDGRQGIKIGTPGVEILEVHQQKGNQSMSKTETQEQKTALETTAHKTRGTLTLKTGTYSEALRLIEDRSFQGTGAHDRLLVDLMAHDATAHQMYELLAPWSERLNAAGPLATLQALIAAAATGGTSAGPVSELLAELDDEEKPVEYLRGLVERDKKFQAGIAGRYENVDFTQMPIEKLRSGIKDQRAAQERYRRAVDAIIAHNNETTDPLHLWYINSKAVRDLVGGKNELVQAYLKTREAEIEAHHQQYSLTPKQNNKNAKIEDEIKIQ